MALTRSKNSEGTRLDNQAILPSLPSRAVAVAATLLLLVLIGQLAYSVSHESLSWDEGDHIFTGYMSWKGDYGMNPEHPPLVKKIATLVATAMTDDLSYEFKFQFGN